MAFISENNITNVIDKDLKHDLLAMSVPTIMGFLLQSVYDLVDMMWVGRLNSSALAGVTIFSTIFWLVGILNEIIGTSSVSLIAQCYGSGDMRKTRVAIEQTFTFKALVAVLAGFIMAAILNPLLKFFTTDSSVLTAALDYGYIRLFFLPIMFSSFTVNTAFRCLGDAKTPMKIMVVASIVNLVLDPILIFETIPGTSIPGFNLGVFGAGLATVISTVVAFGIGFWIFLSGRTKIKIIFRDLFKLDWEIDKKLLTIGLPNGFEALMRQLASIITLKLVTSYGTSAVAAMGIVNRLLDFSYVPLNSLSIGSSSIVGQCLGADNVPRAKATTKLATKINLGAMIIISLIAIIFPEFLMKIFTDDKEVIAAGIPAIRLLISSLIFAAVSSGLGSVFSGSGYNLPFLIASIISRWIVQIPCMLLVVIVLKLSSTYLWGCFFLANFTSMIVMYYYYKKGTWESKRVG